MKPSVTAIIPARLGSRRFSGKVLHPFRGKPLLFYVWDAARRVRQIERLVIATDSREIAAQATDFGAEVIKTSRKHRTGSDRIAEAVKKTGGEILVNIQADCIGLNPASVNRVISRMINNRDIECATFARRLERRSELDNPNLVKVVVSRDNRALWFSRSALPFVQARSSRDWIKAYPYLGHIGIYLFRRSLLERFVSYPQSRCEKAESLEQLRLLENGHDIQVFRTEDRPVSIDTRSDLKKLNTWYKQEPHYA